MKLSLVVQRYGPEIVGGAERLCRGVAEGLAKTHDVEVITTCARSYVTWSNELREGTEQINGVRVRRFQTERERDIEKFNAASLELFGDGHLPEDEVAWVEAQGPFAPRLVDYLHTIAKDRDRLLFFTYLYYPTVHGIHADPQRSLLVPTAHEEAPLDLEIYDTVFRLPLALVFNTQAEKQLVERRFKHLPTRREVVGVGIDGLDQLERTGLRVVDKPETARLLYAGRIDAGKGVDELVRFVACFRRDSGVKISLSLIGEVAMDLPNHDWLHLLGFVSEAEKIEQLARATVLVAPSPLESFGIAVLEALAAGTPVLVNADSAALVEHCRNGSAGLYYRGYFEFRESLSLLLANEQLRANLAASGANYVRTHYSWPAITARYDQILRDF